MEEGRKACETCAGGDGRLVFWVGTVTSAINAPAQSCTPLVRALCADTRDTSEARPSAGVSRKEPTSSPPPIPTQQSRPPPPTLQQSRRWVNPGRAVRVRRAARPPRQGRPGASVWHLQQRELNRCLHAVSARSGASTGEGDFLPAEDSTQGGGGVRAGGVFTRGEMAVGIGRAWTTRTPRRARGGGGYWNDIEARGCRAA
jgi:hypothetical protein